MSVAEYTSKLEGNQFLHEFRVYRERYYRNSDTVLQYFVLGYFLFGGFLAPIRDSWPIGIFFGGGIVGLYYLIYFFLKNKLLLRIYTSIAFMLFVVQFIVQTGGAFYTGYFYFITMAVLVFYKDWRLILPYFLLGMGYYVTGFFSSYYSLGFMNGLFFTGIEIDLQGALMSLLFTAIHFGICVFLASYLERQSMKEIQKSVYLNEQLNIEGSTALAKEIAQGNLNSSYWLKPNDKLGEALMEMRSNLLQLKDKEQIQRWTNNGISSINELLLNTTDVNKLSNRVIRELVMYMQGQQGAIYLIKESEQGARTLDMVSAFAGGKRKSIDLNLEIGEASAGEAVLKKKTVWIKNVPASYQSVVSGLGEAPPKEIMFVPFKVKDQVLGVLEMASFGGFKEYEKDFLEKVSENIAITILQAIAAENNHKMLEEAKIFNEQLKAQEEEMRLHMESLEANEQETVKLRNSIQLREDELEKIQRKHQGVLKQLSELAEHVAHLEEQKKELEELKSDKYFIVRNDI